MDIAPASVGNDTILARLGLQQIGAPPIVAQPIQPAPNPIPVPPPPPPVVQLQPIAVTPPSVVEPVVELPEKCCAKCSYFRSRTVAGGAIMIGNKPSPSEEINECRRFPPKPSGMGLPAFTRVPKGEWCGEFRISARDELVQAMVKTHLDLKRENSDAANNQAGVQSQPAGMGTDIPKKRGRPAKGIQAGSPAVQAETAAIQPKRKGRPARQQEGA